MAKSKKNKVIRIAEAIGKGGKKTFQVISEAKNVPYINKLPIVKHPMETIGGLAGPGGRAAGKLLGKITGSGDYKVTSNSIMTESTHTLTPDVPSFRRNSDGSTTVSHREFVGDLISSSTPSAFLLQSYPINPGLSEIFPWLNVIAMQYDQWRPDGIVITFKSTSSSYSGGASQALGTVIMASDYDVTDAPYQNKVEMNNSQFAISCKSDHTMMHPIECDSRQRPLHLLKCRDSNAPDNLQWYDLCNFQIASEGVPAANTNLGEIWITYEITFFKEQLYGGVFGGGVLESVFGNTTGVTTGAPFGSNATRINGVGNKIPNLTITSNVVSKIRDNIGNEYSIEYYVQGTAATTAVDAPALSGAIPIAPLVVSFPVSDFIGIGAGTSICCRKMQIRSTAPVWSLTVTGGTYPTLGSSFLRVTQLNRANY